MWEDPIVNEVRKVRLEIEAECGNDLERIFARAVEVPSRFTERLVPAPLHLPKEEADMPVDPPDYPPITLRQDN